jgi:D-amino-acid dehydrogenase
METSFANGGQLSASNAEVWNHWSTILKGLKWMLKSDAPLLVNPEAQLAQAVVVCGVHRQHAALRAQHHRDGAPGHRCARTPVCLGQAEGVDFDLKREGILHIYRDKKGFDHAGEVSKMLAEGGLPRRAVTPEEMKAIEPTLAGDYYGGYFTESDSTGDIHKFTTGLAARPLLRMGVQCLYEQDVEPCAATARRQVTGVTVPASDAPLRPWWCAQAWRAAALPRSWVTGSTSTRSRATPSPSHLNDAQSQAAAPTVSLLDDETKLVTSRLGWTVSAWPARPSSMATTRTSAPTASAR